MNKLKNFFFSFKILFLSSKKYFVLKIIMSIICASLSFLNIFFWKELIEFITEYVGEKNSNFFTGIIFYLLIYIVIYIFDVSFAKVNNYISYMYNDDINYYFDNMMISKISTVDINFFDSSSIANATRNTWDMLNTTKTLVEMIFNFIIIILKAIFSTIILIGLDYKIILVIIFACVLTFILDSKIKKTNYQFEKDTAHYFRKVDYFKSIYFEENIQEIKLYNLNDYFKNKYIDNYKKIFKKTNKKERKIFFCNLFETLISFASNIYLYIYLLKKLLVKIISFADFTYYVSIFIQFRLNITNIFSMINSFRYTLEELNDIKNFFEFQSISESSGKEKITTINTIEFKNVFYKYPLSEQYVLKNCSFKINKNDIVGLVGLNGAGKSTIIKLLLKLYVPQKGIILINGININNLDVKEYRNKISVLFQEVTKYSLSFREYISTTNLSRLNDDSMILNACKIAEIDELVTQWEKGLDEQMTKRFYNDGKELSGGQWQKIAIARTLFKNGELILLDEPSSALDPIAEEKIFEKFYHLCKNKTAFLISHRLSSIKIANRILVLDKGKIVEDGTHKELIRKKGKYYELFKMQSSKYQVNKKEDLK